MQVNTKATEVALKAASTEVSNFVLSAEKEVIALEERFANIVPIATTKEGYAQCKDARKELMPIKKGLEDARKLLKAPILEAGKLVDSTMNPLAERIGALITPFVDAYQAVDQELERKKQARLNTIIEAFKAFDNAVVNVIGKSSDEIQTSIDELCDFDLDPKTFMERTDEAAAKYGETMERLGALLMQTVQAEEMQAKQQAMDEREAKILEAEEREQARIDKLAADAEQAKQDKIDEKLKAQRDAEIEKAREEARKEAELLAQEAHKQALSDAEQKAIQLAADAVKAELERIEAQQAQEATEAKAREDNKRHKGAIHSKIHTAFLTTGITETQSKALIKLIATRQLDNIRITY